MAEALYRKYRPQVFEDVVGQEPIERTLKNAIEQDKVSHAYLFCGPRGTGKTTTARLLAKALLCQGGPTPAPDGTCEDCRLIADGAHPDVYELDAASRTGVENVREEIISRVQFAPTRGRFKIYIIDEVHMLSTAAFNALLKTLEEPPSHVVFVLCTTDPQKVPETIHSRCQRFDFRRIAPEGMVSRLGAICMAEGVEFEGEALDLIAHRAEGGLRNALTSLEQIIAFENGKVTLAGAERLLGSIDSNDMAEIMAYVGKRDIASCFRWTSDYVETGADLAQFVRDMAEHVRNLYVLALAGDEVELDVSEAVRRELASEIAWFGPDRAARLLGVLGDLSSELRTTSNPRLAFEIALTRMVRPDSDLTLAALAERVEALESGYSAVAHVLPGEMLADVADGGSSGSSGGAGAPAGGKSSFNGDPGPGVVGEDLPKAGAPAPPEDPAFADTQSGRGISGEQAGQSSAFGGEAGSGPEVPGAASNTGAPGVAQKEATLASNQQPQGSAPAQQQANAGNGVGALANPATLQRVWQAALSAVKREKQAYAVLFINTKAVFDQAASMVKVVFPAESSFLFNTAQKQEVREVLAQALQKAVGEPVPFDYELRGASSAAPAQVQQQVQAQSQSQSQSQPQVQVQDQAQPQARSKDEAQPQPQPQAQAPEKANSQGDEQSRNLPAESSAAQEHAAAAPADAPYDQVPYEEVPYEEVPYDEVPYEEFDSAPAQAAPEPDAGSGASPSDNRDENGALADDSAAVQAMLQASFGSGVVLSETDE